MVVSRYSGYGNGDGTGYGNGNGYGYGNGNGSGTGSGTGYGYSSGYGSGTGYGNGNGYGYGYSIGYGSGSNNGDGTGYGNGNGYGYGYGTGDGYGYNSTDLRGFLDASGTITLAQVLQLRNTEVRRGIIETLGPDRIFEEGNLIIIHEDTDGCGNRRQLVRILMPDAEAGYLQAVHVVCPSTGRQYYLGVPPGVDRCQDAVASTFNLDTNGYHPIRET